MSRSDSPAEATDFASLPLYNTSFTLYRCSPLHLPRNTNEDAFRKTLSTHTRRFADHLQREARPGLAVFGVDDSDALTRAGPLKQTTWTWDGVDADAPDALEGPDGFGLTEGVRIVVEFERATYAALLLRRRNVAPSAEEAVPDSEHHRLQLPLLFVRMPTALRGVLLSYLAAHFDARADPVHVPGPRMARALEDYLGVMAPAESDDTSPLKDVQLTLAFPDPALKSLDVAVPGGDVRRFIALGAPATATPASTAPRDAGPFTRALAAYLRTHLALDPSHRDVRLARVACGAWAVATEGRVKIFAPKSRERDAARDVVDKLLQRLMEGKAEDGDADVVMN